MTLSTTEIKHLNKMNRSAQDISLGTTLNDLITSASSVSGTLAVDVATLQGNMVTPGSLLVTTAQAAASAITIQTTVNPIVGKLVQGYRSGSPLTMKTMMTGSNLNITSASPTYWVIAAGDEINYNVW
jgi:hypothetical protein